MIPANITLTAKESSGFDFSGWTGCTPLEGKQIVLCWFLVSRKLEPHMRRESGVRWLRCGGVVRTSTRDYICSKECAPLSVSYSALSAVLHCNLTRTLRLSPSSSKTKTLNNNEAEREARANSPPAHHPAQPARRAAQSSGAAAGQRVLWRASPR